jgi:hypothetical protein
MPWSLQSSTLTTNMEGRALDHPYVPFYEGILEMPSEGLLESWADQPDLDEPRSKSVEGADAFVRWAAQTREWLVGADAATRPVYLIVTPTRTVEEVAIDLAIDGERRELPVAIVADRNSLGLTAIRVYHSMWPLIRGHLVRSPLLRSNPNITIPDVVGDYQRALAAGDLEGILATYQDDAVVREPAGAHTSLRAKRQYATSTRCSSQMVQASHCSNAPSPTTVSPARWSGTPRSEPPRVR